MKKEEYPSLYRAADEAAASSQNLYVRLIAIDLVLMVISALATIYNFQSNDAKEWVYVISAAIMGASIILTIIVKTQKFEARWYKGRALAESAKTLTWRYITGSQNFEINLTSETANAVFISRMEELANEFKDFTQFLDASTLAQPAISEAMQQCRSMSLNDRQSSYILNRIRDQKHWYSTKATFNKRMKNFWFYTIIVCQALSVISSVYLIKMPSSNLNFVGLFTTISAACLAWLQLKQHESLSVAYTTAVIELNFIEEKSKAITSEEDFVKFVLDSENAISREHTLWLAQKI
ncbi:MAG TPA: DUF4231 domain-containing protein [Ohtaekwangia sp.]|uniref:DUF4231 domain-containing protein n=1 Tax=Ohtaekwangia sp. TaxID=2066019 RepID=UPI002F941A3B